MARECFQPFLEVGLEEAGLGSNNTGEKRKGTKSETTSQLESANMYTSLTSENLRLCDDILGLLLPEIELLLFNFCEHTFN